MQFQHLFLPALAGLVLAQDPTPKVDGYNSQTLNTSTMNAPLWDCTNTWTYLGYKSQPAGSNFDPRLCAAACEAQTAYNKANPPPSKGGKAVAPVTCNAFGTYILTKTNKTGSYREGQICTLYTVYWDKVFAVNTASYDDATGAKYTYSSSSFYGKQGAQPACNGTSAVSSSGTYVKGGSAP